MISEQSNYRRVVLWLNNTERVGIKTKTCRPMPSWFDKIVYRRVYLQPGGRDLVTSPLRSGRQVPPMWGAKLG